MSYSELHSLPKTAVIYNLGKLFTLGKPRQQVPFSSEAGESAIGHQAHPPQKYTYLQQVIISCVITWPEALFRGFPVSVGK